MKNFRESGFLYLPDFWTDDEIDAIHRESTNIRRKVAPAPRDDAALIAPISQYSSLFRALPFNSRLVSCLADLYGMRRQTSRDVISYLSQLSSVSEGTGWRQEGAVFRLEEPHKGIVMCTPVHGSVGKVSLIAGYHNKPLLPHVRQAEKPFQPLCFPAEEKAQSLSLQPRDCLFFNFAVPFRFEHHAASASEWWLMYHFVTADIFSFRRFPLPVNAEWIAPVVWGPSCTAGQVEYAKEMDWSAAVREVC
jgi:hypothetical protein